MLRRLVDVAAGLGGGLLTLPLALVVALVVWVTTGRPVLFHQIRCGRGCLPFRIAKFRTMADVRDADGALLADEARLTGMGRVLRRTRLDELPQFWNLVAGHVSLIGPRPLLPATINAMGVDGVRRCTVRPGLTGWAQVNGGPLLTDKDKIALDLWYIDQASLRLDLMILLRTAAVLVRGDRIARSILPPGGAVSA